jgi:hypothetical protein
VATKQDLEDQLKQRDHRIAELKDEIDELRYLNEKLRTNQQVWREQFESWKEAFRMVMGDDGVWTWNSDDSGGQEWLDKYLIVARDYNSLIRDYENVVSDRFGNGTLRDPGRPIAATPEQREIIYQSHEEGRSLREIAEDADVGLQTVRTLLGKIDGTDRVSRRLFKYFEAHIDRKEVTAWKAHKRVRDALPKRLHEHSKQTEKLIKEVKGGR